MRRIASVEHLVCVFSCVVAVSLRYLDHFQDIREEIEPKECFYSVIYLRSSVLDVEAALQLGGILTKRVRHVCSGLHL